MQIFRSMMWLCVHSLWDSQRIQPNTEASLTTMTTMAVALHILKCTLCKITFSTLNGRAVGFPEVCVFDFDFCDTLHRQLSSSPSLKKLQLLHFNSTFLFKTLKSDSRAILRSDFNALKVWHLCGHGWKWRQATDFYHPLTTRFMSNLYFAGLKWPPMFTKWSPLNLNRDYFFSQ